VPESLIVLLALVVVLSATLLVVRSSKTRSSGKERPPSSRPERSPSSAEAPELSPEPAPETAVAVPVPSERTPTPTKPVRPTLKDRLGRSRKFFSERLADVLSGGIDEDVFDDLEAMLIQADVGVEIASRITSDIKAKASRSASGEEIKALLADELIELFDVQRDRDLVFAPESPTVWMIVGVNGTGKTTTIGKLANDLRERGHSVALAAADTFRAAADEQLGVWAERTGSQMVKHQPGADPGAVAFDAYRFAAAREIDVLLIDTAGRLHTKTPLMDELSKVRRVIEKEGKVHEALLVIDATAGQNGLVQAREFSQASGVTGVVLTKLDGSAKGGIVLAIEHTLGLPVKLIGVGEGVDDLEPFEPKTFVDALLS
jgi:fused signal recognition particle receptor